LVGFDLALILEREVSAAIALSEVACQATAGADEGCIVCGCSLSTEFGWGCLPAHNHAIEIATPATRAVATVIRFLRRRE
jgi:hypothetical protein